MTVYFFFLFFFQCTFYPPCKSSHEENKETVKEYVKQYGVRYQNYTCLYNFHNVNEVIRTKRFEKNQVVHGLVWPILTLVIGILALLITIRKRGCVVIWYFVIYLTKCIIIFKEILSNKTKNKIIFGFDVWFTMAPRNKENMNLKNWNGQSPL